jgi:protein TonB
MAKVDLIDNSWTELVFEGKNKEYGAYVLRQETGKRNVKALLIVLLAIGAIFLAVFLNVQIQNALKQDVAIETDVELSKLAQKKEAEVER